MKEEKAVRRRKLCLASYVVEANIHHPTNTSLLGDGIRVITRTVLKVKKIGLAVGMPFVNHTKKMKKDLKLPFTELPVQIPSEDEESAGSNKS